MTKGIKIKLDKTRTLKFDLRAMSTFEQVTGKNFFFDINWERIGAFDMQALIFSCLAHEDDNLTFDDVGDMINIDNMASIKEQLDQIMEENSPDVGEDSDTGEESKKK
jgi:hypothetical protein